MDNENVVTNEQEETREPMEKTEPVELTELFVQKRKTVTLSDTITLQAIICVAISIVYIFINMAFPQSAVEMYDTYKSNFYSKTEENPISAVMKSISEFVNSTPVEYD